MAIKKKKSKVTKLDRSQVGLRAKRQKGDERPEGAGFASTRSVQIRSGLVLDERDFVPSVDTHQMSPGKMLETLRKLQEMSQNELSECTGISQANISNMETGKQQIGRERALTLAKALNVHPGIILFPGYSTDDGPAA